MSSNGDDIEDIESLSGVPTEAAEDMIPWLEEFSGYQTEIVDLLDEIKRHDVEGELQESLEKTRMLADSKQGAFQLVAYTVFEPEELLEFLETHFSEDYSSTVDHLEYIIENYSVLAPLLRVAYMEKFMNRYQPITTYDSSINYAEGEQAPLIRYLAKSGGAPLFETQMSSSVAMYVAASMIATVNESIEWVVEEDLDIAEGELEDFNEIGDTLIDAIREQQEFLETISKESDKQS